MTTQEHKNAVITERVTAGAAFFGFLISGQLPAMIESVETFINPEEKNYFGSFDK